MAHFEINKDAVGNLPVALHSVSIYSKQSHISRPNGFDYAQILRVVDGCGTYQIGGQNLLLSKGQGIWMRSGVPHSYGGENFNTAWCSFSISVSFFDFLNLDDYLLFEVPPFLDRESKQLMDFANGESTLLERSAACYAYLTEFFSYILSQKESFSDKVLHLLEQRYSEPLSLADIADFFHVDRYTLCHRYKQERGHTVLEDLTRIRLKKAKQFLKYDSSSIEEIGKLCGFENPSYFGKRFRELSEYTPTEYRRKHRT